MYIIFVFLSSKCSLFHNSNVFGSCIIHILYKGCAKIKNKIIRSRKFNNISFNSIYNKNFFKHNLYTKSTPILCLYLVNLFPPRNLCNLLHNVEKYHVAGQATRDNMAHAHCVLDTEGYKHTHTQYVIRITFPLQ